MALTRTRLMEEPEPIGSQVVAAIGECPDRTTWTKREDGAWACGCCKTAAVWQALKAPELAAAL